MENNLLIETVRIKELMGIKGNLISEGIKLPSRLVQALRRGAATFIGDGEDMLRREMPGLPSVISMNDIITQIGNSNTLSNSTVKALLHVNHPELRGLILDALSDSNEVRRAVNMLNNAIKNNKQSEVDALERLIKTDFVPENDLDDLVQVTTQKIDADRKIGGAGSRTPIRTAQIRERIQQIDKDLTEFNDKTLVELWGSKADVRMKARLKKFKSDFANLKKDPEFENAVNFIEEQLDGKNVDFSTKVSEIEAVLKAKHPNAFKRFFYNRNKVVGLILTAALVGAQFDLKELLKKGGKAINYLFQAITGGLGEATAMNKKYTNTPDGFKKYLTDEGITFTPIEVGIGLNPGTWNVSVLDQSRGIYKYVTKDETFQEVR